MSELPGVAIHDWLFVPASREYPDSARWELRAYWLDHEGQEWTTSVAVTEQPDGELDAMMRQYLVQAVEHEPRYSP